MGLSNQEESKDDWISQQKEKFDFCGRANAEFAECSVNNGSLDSLTNFLGNLQR